MGCKRQAVEYREEARSQPDTEPTWSQLPPSRDMGLGRVLSFYLRLDSGTHFLNQAALEVMDALVTTGSVPFSGKGTRARTRRVWEA